MVEWICRRCGFKSDLRWVMQRHFERHHKALKGAIRVIRG